MSKTLIGTTVSLNPSVTASIDSVTANAGIASALSAGISAPAALSAATNVAANLGVGANVAVGGNVTSAANSGLVSANIGTTVVPSSGATTISASAPILGTGATVSLGGNMMSAANSGVVSVNLGTGMAPVSGTTSISGTVSINPQPLLSLTAAALSAGQNCVLRVIGSDTISLTTPVVSVNASLGSGNVAGSDGSLVHLVTDVLAAAKASLTLGASISGGGAATCTSNTGLSLSAIGTYVPFGQSSGSPNATGLAASIGLSDHASLGSQTATGLLVSANLGLSHSV